MVIRMYGLNYKDMRGKSYDDYGISVYRYKELKNFCLQYREKKDAVERGLTSHQDLADRVPSGSMRTGSVVESQAIRNVVNHADCLLIEAAAMRTDPKLARWIVHSVSTDDSYAEMIGKDDTGPCPVGSTDFYAARRLFYAVLDRMQRERIKL